MERPYCKGEPIIVFVNATRNLVLYLDDFPDRLSRLLIIDRSTEDDGLRPKGSSSRKEIASIHLLARIRQIGRAEPVRNEVVDPVVFDGVAVAAGADDLDVAPA